MKKHNRHGIILLAGLLTAFACSGPKSSDTAASGPDSAAAENTPEQLNKPAGSPDIDQARQQLDSIYQQIQQEYAEDRGFISALKRSQESWEASCKADLTLRFPERAGEPLNVTYGSVVSTCLQQEQTARIRQRIAFLNQWLEGVPEGEVCAGSVKKAD